MNEQVLQRLILARLQQAGIFAWRANTGAARAGERVVHFGLKGQADILGILPGGRLLAVEVKSERGQLRPEQAAFRDRIVAAGGLYILARTLDDVMGALC